MAKAARAACSAAEWVARVVKAEEAMVEGMAEVRGSVKEVAGEVVIPATAAGLHSEGMAVALLVEEGLVAAMAVAERAVAREAAEVAGPED